MSYILCPSYLPRIEATKPPAIEKNFLISPPGSPPVGWEPLKEDLPSSSPLVDDLIQALRKLTTLDDDQPAYELGVFVEDCDARFSLDVADDDTLKPLPR